MSTFLPTATPVDPHLSNAPTTALPHFLFPFARGSNGHVNVVEQDTIDHIISCEMVIAYCPLGSRQERPEFGWDWPIYGITPVNTTSLVTALQTFEPRGTISNVTDLAATVGPSVRNIEVDVQIGSET